MRFFLFLLKFPLSNTDSLTVGLSNRELKGAKKVASQEQQTQDYEENFTTTLKRNRRLLWVGIFITLMGSFSLMDPFLPGNLALNDLLLHTMPAGFLLLAFLTSVGAYFGAVSIDRHRIWQRNFQERFRKDMKAATTLRYRCFFKKDENGSVWEITNISTFDWDKAVVLIEKKEGQDIETEKYTLNSVEQRRKVVIHSDLSLSSRSKWRIMIVTKEGYQVIFPEFLKNFDIAKAKKYIIDS